MRCRTGLLCFYLLAFLVTDRALSEEATSESAVTQAAEHNADATTVDTQPETGQPAGDLKTDSMAQEDKDSSPVSVNPTSDDRQESAVSTEHPADTSDKDNTAAAAATEENNVDNAATAATGTATAAEETSTAGAAAASEQPVSAVSSDLTDSSAAAAGTVAPSGEHTEGTVVAGTTEGLEEAETTADAGSPISASTQKADEATTRETAQTTAPPAGSLATESTSNATTASVLLPGEDKSTEAPSGTTETDQSTATQGSESSTASPVTMTTESLTEVSSTDAPVTEGISSERPDEFTTEESFTTAGVFEGTTAQTDNETEATTAPSVVPSFDPCNEGSHQVLDNPSRHFRETAVDKYLPDDSLSAGWYKFTHKGEVAEIPAVCLKVGQCSSNLPITVDLRGQEEPSEGQTISAWVRTIVVVQGQASCSSFQHQIQIKRCHGDFFIYKLPAADVKGSAYCTKLPSEKVPVELQGDYIPPTTTVPPATTTQPETTTQITTTKPTTLVYQEIEKSTKPEVDSTVTIVFQTREPMTEEMMQQFDSAFRDILIAYLNGRRHQPIRTTPIPSVDHDAEGATPKPKQQETPKPDEVKNLVPDTINEGDKVTEPEAHVPDVDPDASGPVPNPRGKRDTAVAKQLETEDVVYIGSLPKVKGEGKLEVSLFVRNETAKEGLITQNELLDALEQLNATGKLPFAVNMSVVSIFAGLPSDVTAPDAVVKPTTDLWHDHMGLFICMIVLAGLCLIIIIIGLMCIRCRRSGTWFHDDKSPIRLEEGTPEKQPLPMDSPLSDDEITREEAPMVECENPGYTPNGGGEHISKEDEENGWVVPISELTPNERDQPEVEDTKL